MVGGHGRDIDGDMPAQRERWLPQQRSRLNAAQPCARLQPAEPAVPLATGAGKEEAKEFVGQCRDAAHQKFRSIHGKQIKTAHRISMGRGATGETTVRSLDPDYPCESARVNAMQQVQGQQQQQLPVQRMVGVECCATRLMVCSTVVSCSGQSSAPVSIPAPAAKQTHYTRPGGCVKLGGR